MKKLFITLAALLCAVVAAEAAPKVSKQQVERYCNMSVFKQYEKYSYYCQFVEPKKVIVQKSNPEPVKKEESIFLTKENGIKQDYIELARKYEGFRADKNRTVLASILDVDPLKTAWCAAFVNTILKQSGYMGSGSLMARSFLNYGKPTKQPREGDIAVFKRGRSDVTGHVGFYMGEETIDGVRYILVLGGNQNKEVNVAYYPANLLLGYRRVG